MEAKYNEEAFIEIMKVLNKHKITDCCMGVQILNLNPPAPEKQEPNNISSKKDFSLDLREYLCNTLGSYQKADKEIERLKRSPS